MKPVKLGVICDLIEEGWPSMDLVANMLIENLHVRYSDLFKTLRVLPKMQRRFSRGGRNHGNGFNIDRILNRFWYYPREIKRIARELELFHLVDHSYAHLAHNLPTKRTIVTCHDVDTFRCLLEPEQEPRSKAFRFMTERILDGMRKVAWLTCDSHATLAEVVKYGLFPATRTTVIHNGVHPSCSAEAHEVADRAAADLLLDGVDRRAESEKIDLLHVGSTVGRKRIDVLLQVFAEVRTAFPAARLIRVGGALTPVQQQMAIDLGLTDSILTLPLISHEVLAAIYRRATLIVQPSEREGFGLPVIEAMACGAPVVASDLAVLHEVGGDAAIYCPVADVRSWSMTIKELLRQRVSGKVSRFEHRDRVLAQAAKFTWAEYTRKMVSIYQQVLEG